LTESQADERTPFDANSSSSAFASFRSRVSNPSVNRKPEPAVQKTVGNFDTLRPLTAVLEDYKRVLETIYQPAAYAARLRRLASLLDRSGSHRSVPTGDLRGRVGALELVHRIVSALPETRELFWQVLTTCARENPNATRIIVGLMALYLHLGPFSHRAIAAINRRIGADVAAAKQLNAPTALPSAS
jgi:hypothetical protein